MHAEVVPIGRPAGSTVLFLVVLLPACHAALGGSDPYAEAMDAWNDNQRSQAYLKAEEAIKKPSYSSLTPVQQSHMHQMLGFQDFSDGDQAHAREHYNLACRATTRPDSSLPKVTPNARMLWLEVCLELANGGTAPVTPPNPVPPPPPEWVQIPGGTFQMGSEVGDSDEKPVHSVTLSSFEMKRTEVTFGEYEACVKAGKCTAAHVDDGTCYVYDGSSWKQGKLPASFRGADQPVVCVDWEQAQDYAKWAGGRLPTEAQWEYAARSGGKDWKYPWGPEEATCDRAIMWKGNQRGCGRDATWPVCSRPGGNTVQGLCDMAGNVWEWTADWYGEYPKAGGTGPSTGSLRVIRGGSWGDTAGLLRAANRDWYDPGYRFDALGFRLVR